MARTKKNKPGSKARDAKKMASTQPKQTPEELYGAALQLVEQSQPEEALKIAKQLWSQVQDRSVTEALPAVNLLGEISIELGAVDSAREYFEKAVQLDPEGRIPEALGGGAEKFLWLAQLCDEGGKQAVDWFEKGAKALQLEITALETGQVPGLDEQSALLMRVDKKRKLANALCGIVEVYMTDLSWEDDAEARCESLVTEAMAVEDETSPEVLQTLASVRLSQERKADAQAALKRSLAIWMDLEPEDPAVPDFATKISLSRLLMEAELEHDAMEVLHMLILEDDQSVEAWYLGGWCQHLISDRNGKGEAFKDDSAMDTSAGETKRLTAENAHLVLKGSRRWLKTSLKLYKQQDYEDDRLYDHACELVANLDKVLGSEDEQTEGGDEAEWEPEWDGIDDGEDSDEDEHMQDS
jgi:predicted Zn-dependent protease